ncbi:TonB-dependent receptor plug [Methylomonas methanica MC09]|uniref:TonB-dependent receptor plug n=2 Tax=Methylomonas methanica TaxID=421 RepID=G0A4C5_METMM|nr:TonB-dependent receptor plug [Methylomonas methanica MC09]
MNMTKPLLFLVILLPENTPAMDDLELIYGNNKMISIASGHAVPINRAPSVTSVITQDDIEAIGARRLEDVLEFLPGIHVSSARAGNKVIGFRGIYSEANTQVLVLVNGIPFRNTAIGGKPLAWTMPVKNISQIEIIRGPGSMLYGGDATTGVINIITKAGGEIGGGYVGGFFGSQDSYEGWAQYGQKETDWEYAVSLQGGTTGGTKGIIQRDAQTVLDGMLGTAASYAPGFTNFGRDDIDARIDLTFQDWLRLRVGYQRFNNVRTGEGAALALDPKGWTDEDIYNLDLSMKHQFSDALGLDTTFYFIGQDTRWNYNLLPAGTFGGSLPQGAESRTTYFQGTTGLTTQFNYAGIQKHKATLGAGIIYHWVTDVSNKINYLITPNFVTQIPLTEVSAFGSDPVLSSKTRTNFYALFQDEWNFANDFYLTTGLRYDYYSDILDGISPRVSLVWNANNNLTAKLLYGRSFRPPSFLEKNLPLSPGTNIKSESVNTLEFQIENKWSPRLATSANLYWFEFNNLITSVSDSTLTSMTSVSPNPVAFTNIPKINGIGLETEMRYAFADDLNFSVNYSYHGVGDSNQTGLLPKHMIKSLINWEFVKGWRVGAQLNWIGERHRPKNDPRVPLRGYFIAGLTLSTQVAKPIEFVIRANNIFGSLAKEPSLNPILLPGDVPLYDRSVLGQIKWTF